MLLCYKILGVIPLTSCNCERGFSAMNILKNYLSNLLSSKMIDSILTIKDKKEDRDIFYYLERSLDITNVFDGMKDGNRRGPYANS